MARVPYHAPWTTGNVSCSVHGAIDNGICFKAQCDGSFSVTGAIGNSLCSGTTDDGSYSVYGATDGAICSNVMGDGLEPPHTGNGICSDAIFIAISHWTTLLGRQIPWCVSSTL